MAFEFTGSAEILRIVELLTKVLSPSELPNYYLAIDNNSDDETYKVSLSALLALGGGSFNDAVFEVYNDTDNTKKLNLSLASISTATTITLTIPDISGLIAVAGMLNAFSFGGQASGGSIVETFSATKTFNLNNGNSQKMILTGNVTSLSLSNKVNGGSYLIYLVQDGTGSRTIPPLDSSFGSKTDNSVAVFATAANAVNLINVNVDPEGVTYWTLETYTP